jgi:cardiolipin synthase
MNIPNTLTVIRFFLVPIFIIVFFSPSEASLQYAVYIFIAAGISDVLDGYIARRYKLITKWGQVMDPLADKLMQLTVLICFTVKEIIPIWGVVIIGLKELLMICGSLYLYLRKQKMVIPANKYGKFDTLIFYVAIIFVAFKLPFSTYLLGIAVLLTAYAFARYLVGGMHEIKKKNEGLS